MAVLAMMDGLSDYPEPRISMAQILWRPIMDELDRRMFVFVSEYIPGWTPVNGWKGTDIDDPDSLYSLETAQRGEEIRGLLHKAKRYQDTKMFAIPDVVSDAVIEEAASHLGLAEFTSKPVEGSPTQSIWIIKKL